MKCFRRIAGKTRRDSIRNERIREDLGKEGIENRLVKRQLKWYGHVVRMGEERKPKQFLEQDQNEEDQEEDRERVMRME
jgi:hypothetical protein